MELPPTTPRCTLTNGRTRHHQPLRRPGRHCGAVQQGGEGHAGGHGGGDVERAHPVSRSLFNRVAARRRRAGGAGGAQRGEPPGAAVPPAVQRLARAHAGVGGCGGRRRRRPSPAAAHPDQRLPVAPLVTGRQRRVRRPRAQAGVVQRLVHIADLRTHTQGKHKRWASRASLFLSSPNKTCDAPDAARCAARWRACGRAPCWPGRAARPGRRGRRAIARLGRGPQASARLGPSGTRPGWAGQAERSYCQSNAAARPSRRRGGREGERRERGTEADALGSASNRLWGGRPAMARARCCRGGQDAGPQKRVSHGRTQVEYRLLSDRIESIHVHALRGGSEPAGSSARRRPSERPTQPHLSMALSVGHDAFCSAAAQGGASATASWYSERCGGSADHAPSSRFASFSATGVM